jgi:hypothetical protein
MMIDVSPQSTTIMAWSYKGIAGATTLVLLTTLDDVVWLVPFLVDADRPDGRSSSLIILHGATFVLTLVTLALSLCLVTWLGVMVVAVLSSSTTTLEGDSQIAIESSLQEIDVILGITGATICWVLAACLVYKRWKKKRQRRERQLQQQLFEALEDDSIPTRRKDYSSILLAAEPEGTAEDNDEEGNSGISSPKPMLVASLTFLGFLDELAYFPSLILGRIFSIPELCIGTLLAGLIMLAIVTIALVPFQPCIQWIDQHIKLYMVVTVFAFVLTVRVTLEARDSR